MDGIITRRDFLCGSLATVGAIIGHEATALAISEPSRRPWAKRTAELEERDGIWADYSAWREWIWKREEDFKAEDALGDLDYRVDTMLYCLMCELADGRNELR